MTDPVPADRVAPLAFESPAAIIDALRAQLNLHSDGAVARVLKVHRAAVSNWRVGRGTLSPKAAREAARLLDLPAEPIVLSCLATSEPDEDMRSFYRAAAAHFFRSDGSMARKWRELCKKIGLAAPAIVATVLGLALLANPYISRAATHSAGAATSSLGIFCQIIRRWLRRLALLAAPLALAGCAALSQPAEMAWQAGNVVDAVQTDQMVTHGACIEGDPITRAEIGEKPSDGAVAVWALVGGAVHAGVSELLIHTNHPTLLKVWDGLTLADKWGTVARSFTLRGC